MFTAFEARRRFRSRSRGFWPGVDALEGRTVLDGYSIRVSGLVANQVFHPGDMVKIGITFVNDTTELLHHQYVSIDMSDADGGTWVDPTNSLKPSWTVTHNPWVPKDLKPFPDDGIQGPFLGDSNWDMPAGSSVTNTFSFHIRADATSTVPGAATAPYFTVTQFVGFPPWSAHLAQVIIPFRISAAKYKLDFLVQPKHGAPGKPLSPTVQVAVENLKGVTDTSFNGLVGLTLQGGDPTAHLVGLPTARAVKGIATFRGLGVDRAGTGYVLVASTADGSTATSSKFNVSAPQIIYFDKNNEKDAEVAVADVITLFLSGWDPHGGPIRLMTSDKRFLYKPDLKTKVLEVEPDAQGSARVQVAVPSFFRHAAPVLVAVQGSSSAKVDVPQADIAGKVRFAAGSVRTFDGLPLRTGDPLFPGEGQIDGRTIVVGPHSAAAYSFVPVRAHRSFLRIDDTETDVHVADASVWGQIILGRSQGRSVVIEFLNYNPVSEAKDFFDNIGSVQHTTIPPGTQNGDLTASGTTLIPGASHIKKDLTLMGDLGVRGDLVVDGRFRGKGALYVNGDATFNGPVDYQGTDDVLPILVTGNLILRVDGPYLTDPRVMPSRLERSAELPPVGGVLTLSVHATAQRGIGSVSAVIVGPDTLQPSDSRRVVLSMRLKSGTQDDGTWEVSFRVPRALGTAFIGQEVYRVSFDARDRAGRKAAFPNAIEIRQDERPEARHVIFNPSTGSLSLNGKDGRHRFEVQAATPSDLHRPDPSVLVVVDGVSLGPFRGVHELVTTNLGKDSTLVVDKGLDLTQ